MTTTLENILQILSVMTVEGATGKELEAQAILLLSKYKCEAAFLGYKPDGVRPYPSVLCVSVNGGVIHGVPNDTPFEDGDVVKIDIGLKSEDGQFDDGATTVLVGKGSSSTRRLLKATKEALMAGIHAAKPGHTNLDVARAIEAVALREEVAVVHGYGGHGIGTSLHMEPFIPNEVTPDSPAVVLEKGMRLAIEPMFATKGGDTVVGSDGWLIRLVGGGVAAHFEKTITI